MSTMELEKKKSLYKPWAGTVAFYGCGSLLEKEEGMFGSDLLARVHILDTSCPESNVKLSLYFNWGQAMCCKNLSFKLPLFSDRYYDSK